MHILRAEVLGLCFGVRDALAVMADLPDPSAVTVHGELVHNEVVLTQLKVRGFSMVAETRRAVPETPAVLVTAHGVSDKERGRLAAAGKTVIDTTCPLVKRVHKAAQRLAREVEHVIVIGRPGHVEVVGIVEDLPSADVVPDVRSVGVYPFATLGVVCQTTTPPALVQAVRLEIERRNPHAAIKFVDTVCAPTREHQRSLEALLPRVEAVVVVGGSNSNNTRELAERSRRAGKRVLHVTDAADLLARWDDAFAEGVTTIGLTAGTSTLAETVDEVEAALRGLVGESRACRTRTGNQSVMSRLL